MASRDERTDDKDLHRRLHDDDPEKYSDASSSSSDDEDEVDGPDIDDDFIRRMIQMRLMGAEGGGAQGKEKVPEVNLKVTNRYIRTTHHTFGRFYENSHTTTVYTVLNMNM